MSYKRLKLNLRVFLAGHIVAMVTYCATKLTATCSPMIGHFVDTMILASTYKRVVIMTYQTVSLGKYWKLFPTTLRTFAPIVSAHPYCARKFTCHVTRRVRALSTIMKSDRAHGH